MFIFGHLGIGSKLVSPWSSGLSRKAVLVGTLLPDLIDKPLYFSLSLATGKEGAELGLISGTRTLGHTAILLLLLALGSIIRRSKLLAALALGTATHLFLDNLSDHFLPAGHEPSALMAMTWPILSHHFQALSTDPKIYASSLTPFVLGAEVVGFALLGWEQWKHVNEGEILAATRERRLFFKRIKRSKGRGKGRSN